MAGAEGGRRGGQTAQRWELGLAVKALCPAGCGRPSSGGRGAMGGAEPTSVAPLPSGRRAARSCRERAWM